MSVKIRLRRMGNNNRPFFRVTVADSRSPAKGRFIENIGWYDPVKTGDDNAKIDFERLDYWLDHGAEATVAANALIKRTRKAAATAPADA